MRQVRSLQNNGNHTSTHSRGTRFSNHPTSRSIGTLGTIRTELDELQHEGAARHRLRLHEGIDGTQSQGHTELRQRLLPALQEVRNRLARGEQVNGHDTITGYLAAIGLSEGVIRKWEFRLREKELKELFGTEEIVELPFEYEEDFLTPEELTESRTSADACIGNLRRTNVVGLIRMQMEQRLEVYRRNMQVMWCDVRGTHAEKDRVALLGGILDAPAIIQTIVKKLSARVGRKVNYVSLMCYVDGGHHLDWHQQGEDHGHDTPVMIVPCGQERKFSYRLKGTKERHDVLTHSGSLVVLPSSFNYTHEHAILDDKKLTGTRYAINAKCMDDVYYGEAVVPSTDTNEAPSDEELEAMAEEAGEATAPLPKKDYAPNTRGSHKVLQELAARVQAKYGEGTCSVAPMPEGSPINNGVVLLTIPVSVTRAQTLLKESL